MNKENSRFKIAVADDDELFARKIRQTVQKFWNTENPALKIYKRGTDLTDCLRQGVQYDIYFPDIEMPGISGLKLAESILRISAESCIVLITFYERYVLQSIKTGVLYYILKEEYDREPDKKLFYRKSSTYEKVCLDDICYTDRNGKDAVFYCSRQMKKDFEAKMLAFRERL